MRWLGDKLLAALVWLGTWQRPEYRVKLVGDHPAAQDIEPGVMYVVGGKGYQKWAYFKCPSGDGEITQLCLQQNRRPHWNVTSDFFGRPTVHPSVRQMEGSYAHYWIKRGNVEWCADTGRKPSFTMNG